MSVTGKVKKFFFPSENEYVTNKRPANSTNQTSKIKNVGNQQTLNIKSADVIKEQNNIDKIKTQQVIANPITFEDVLKIADELMKGNPVIVNINNMEKADGKRLIDFLAGVAYALAGDIQRIDQSTFLISARATIGDIRKI